MTHTRSPRSSASTSWSGRRRCSRSSSRALRTPMRKRIRRSGFSFVTQLIRAMKCPVEPPAVPITMLRVPIMAERVPITFPRRNGRRSRTWREWNPSGAPKWLTCLGCRSAVRRSCSIASSTRDSPAIKVGDATQKLRLRHQFAHRRPLPQLSPVLQKDGRPEKWLIFHQFAKIAKMITFRNF